MKKILLATTVLLGTAGFAAAEVTFGGSAAMGIAKDGDNTVAYDLNNGGYHFYSSAKLVATFAGETDTGLSFGASFDTSVGTGYAFADDEGFELKGGSFGTPEVFISGSFGKLSTKIDGYNFLVNDDDADNADVKYVYTSGAITGTAIVEAGGEYSLGADYAADTYTAGVAYDSSTGGAVVKGSYTLGSVVLSASMENTAAGGTKTVKAAYSANGISASVKIEDPEAWEIGAGYSANGITIAATYDNGEAWDLTGSYALGTGATAEVGFNSVEDVYAGVALTF